MEFNRESIGNFIFDLIKYDKVCQNDLEFALDIFIRTEEYEKCSVIKELLELRYYDNRKRKNGEELLKIEKLIENISSGVIFFNKKEFVKEKQRIRKLKEDIESFYEMMKNLDANEIIMPPFKNRKNKKYLLSL